MRRKREYTRGEKAEALAHLAAEDGNVKRAALAAGIPRKTLEGWSKGRGVDAEVLRMTEQSKRTLAGKFMREAEDAIAEAGEKRGAASYRDLMIGAGVAVDKAQLLTGQPTQIIATLEQAAKARAAVFSALDKLSEVLVEAARAKGQEVTLDEARLYVAERMSKKSPQYAGMIAEAMAPCELCGAVGHARKELAAPPPASEVSPAALMQSAETAINVEVEHG